MSSSLNHAGVLAALDALAPDSLQAVEARVEDADESLILHRAADGSVRAWLNVCPHAGRRLDFAPGKFLRSKAGELVCAVHGATFALADGQCVAGPCRGDRLRAVAVRCEDGQVVLDAVPAQ
ncbi:MAG TPA: Rieske 2Fe-2S domain-containing protein [Thermomonas sp.]